MSFGNVITQPCINDTPPPDTRCDDPAFALANPSICPQAATLSIRPEVLLSCVLGSTQLTAVYISNGVEEEVTDSAVWQSDNIAIATVGASTGNVTGLSEGSTTISATYKGLTATSEVVILADDCCEDVNVGMMVVIDKTKSMSQGFGGGYTSKLAYAKAAAKQFISEVNYTKDKVGLISFTDEGYTVHSALSDDIADVEALVNSVSQTQQLTTFYDALSAAIDELDDASIDRKVILLISDGVDTDTSYSDDDNPIALLSDFKANGGIVICLGTRSHGAGYSLLNAFATGGFFINGYASVSALSLAYLSGLKGYICAGNCVPTGGDFDYQGEANFAEFTNWDVIDGHVDLMGPGYIDLIPGTTDTNDLYVDLAGSRDEYCGTLLSKDSFEVNEGDVVSVSVKLAGNQRINAATNTAQVQVFYRNEDEIAAPAGAPVAVVTPDGPGLAQDEEYVYAYTYVNANGESELSPTASVTVSHEDSVVTLTLAVSVQAQLHATLINIYRTSGALPTSRYYKVGEVAVSGGANETWDDTYRLADVVTELANTTDGVIDPGVMPPTQNTTATPILLISQSITIDVFTQEWTTYSFSATAPKDGDVWVSVSQITSPYGYDSVGLLLGQVTLTSGGSELFTDNFDAENLTYIEPACGESTVPVLTGWNYTYTEDQPQIDNPTLHLMDAVTDPRDAVAGTTVEIGSWFIDDGTINNELDDIAWYTAHPPNQTDSTYYYYQISFLTSGGETATNSGQALNTGWTNVYEWHPASTPESNCTMLAWNAVNLAALGVTHVRVWRNVIGVIDPGDGTWVGGTVPSTPDANPYMRLLEEVAVADGFYIDTLSNSDWLAQYGSDTQGSPTENTTEQLSFSVTTPIYSYSSVTTGTGCYGTGCLDDPMDAQLPDPNPTQVPDIESGSTPPQLYKATKQATATCPAGSVNLSETPLDWTYVSSSLGPPIESVIQLDDGAAIVRHITWPTGYLGGSFTDFVLEGSNNGSTWTELFTASSLYVSSGLLPIYLPSNNTAYEYYRIQCTASYPAVVAAPFNLFHSDGVFGTVAQSVTASAYAESEDSLGAAEKAAEDAAKAYAESQLNCAQYWTKTVPHTETCPAGTYGPPSIGAVSASSLISEADAEKLSTEWSIAAALDELDCEGSNNESVISIPSMGTATPYPSVQYVKAEDLNDPSDTITNVILKLYDFTHTEPTDLSVILQSPFGTTIWVMRNIGGTTAAVNADLVFDDSAGGYMSDPVVSGTYKPVNSAVLAYLNSPAPNQTYSKFSTSTAVSPADQTLRYNNADPALVTEIYISHTDAAGAEITKLAAIDPGNTIFVESTTVTPQIQHRYLVVSNTDNGTYSTLVVTYVSGGTAISNAERCHVWWSYQKTLASFNGESPIGAWSLWIQSNALGDVGTIGGWEVEITAS